MRFRMMKTTFALSGLLGLLGLLLLTLTASVRAEDASWIPVAEGDVRRAAVLVFGSDDELR